MSGGLAIKVGGDTSAFDSAMAKAGDLAKRHALDIATNFQGAAGKINTAFAGISSLSKLPIQLNTAKAAAIGLAGTAALVLASYAVVSNAIGQANEQLDRFIKLGENAEKAGVGVEFFQRFSEAAEKAKLDVNEIEAALKRAGNVVTPKFETPDAIKTRLDELFETKFTGDFQSAGLAAYKAAGPNDNEGRIRAAVTAMQELRDLGEQLAAIDLAERLFGPETAERIRSGRLEIDAIATALDRKREDIVSQEEVERAQAFREQLAAAYTEIDNALQVSVALAGAGQAVLDVWLKIVQQVAGASTAAGVFLDKMLAAGKAAVAAQPPSALQSPLASRAAQEGEGNLAADLGAAAGRGARGKVLYPAPIGPDQPTMTIADPPAPPRRPLSFFTEKPAATGGGKAASPAASPSESIDALQSYINGITRSTAALKAEVDAIGKSNSEKQISINLAKAEEIAKQKGITLSAEQIAKIKEASAATVEYKDKLEEVREQHEALRSVSNSVLGGIVSDARNGTTAMQTLYNAVNRVMDRLADQSVNALTDSLFGKSNSTSGGILSGLFSGSGGSSAGVDVGLKFLSFAEGGAIRGPGTGTSDSIPAMVSNGEFIVTAAATARHRGVLEAINSGNIPKFATGGIVGGGSSSDGSAAVGQTISIAPVIHLNTNGGGTPESNADLSKQIGAQIDATMRSTICSELRRQMRPNGMLGR
jgi:hypothetical protein